MSRKATIDNVQTTPSDEDIAAFFDPDLVADFYHIKRFRHLSALASINDESAADFRESSSSKNYHTLYFSVAFACALFAAFAWGVKGFEWRLFASELPSVPIEVTLNAVPTPPPAVRTDPLPLPPQANDEKPVKDEPSKVIKPEQNPEPAVEEEATPPARLDWKRTLNDVVKARDATSAAPAASSGSGLKAHAQPFDPTLRATLNSPEVERLNRFRPRENIAAEAGGAGSMAKVGDECFYEAKRMPEFELLSDGLPPIVQKVDCDKVFYDGRIKRSDIGGGTESTNNPPNN